MVKFKHIIPEGFYILDIIELNDFNRAITDFHDKKISENDYLETTKIFFSWYLNYCDTIVKGKEYDDEHIVPHIFRPKLTSPLHQREFLHKSIYISKGYVSHLLSVVTDITISRYKTTFSSLCIDLEWLITMYEVHIKKTVERVMPTSGRYPHLRPKDIFYSARSIFYIEECPDISDLYLRDIKPVVMFQIRQIIELYGKGMLGYTEINDSPGVPNKRVTQEAWKFIEKECKKATSRIHLPFSIHLILPVLDWSNSFVHTTFIYTSYIQHYAIQIVTRLFKIAEKPIVIYTGTKSLRTDIAEIRITDYNSLKSDFETHLTDKLKKVVTVNWLAPDQVGAYILSL